MLGFLFDLLHREQTQSDLCYARSEKLASSAILATLLTRPAKLLAPECSATLQTQPTDCPDGPVDCPISYRADLIAALKHEHQQLLQLHSAVSKAAQERDYETANRKLSDFEYSLKSHLAEEFCGLYVYMEYFIYKHQANEDHTRLSSFKLEIQLIGGQFIELLKKYQHPPINSASVDSFLADFTSMRSVLIDRIQREEAILYPLYDIFGTSYDNSYSKLVATG